MSNSPGMLESRAIRVAQARGHAMYHWTRWSTIRSEHGSTRCAICGMGVQYTTNPLPNEIEISGEAVAVDCRGE